MKLPPYDHITLTSVKQMNHYNHWLISQFRPHFGHQTLEIGSGIGTLTRLFAPYTQPTLTEINPAYIQHLKKTFDYPVYRYNIQKTPPASLQQQHFDSIICSNVLEHIKEDRQALVNMYSLLKPGGRLCLFVPAGPAIYGQIDHHLDHCRRYTLLGLESRLKSAGFEIITLRYSNLVGFFTWWLSGKVLKEPAIKPLPAKIFDIFFTPLLYLEKYLPLPFGQNLLVVAQKPSN